MLLDHINFVFHPGIDLMLWFCKQCTVVVMHIKT
jgi:hypothetical protein